jgi:hypothetical protein
MDVIDATSANCCVHCLRQGRTFVETLRHVALECGAYQECRQTISELLAKTPLEIFTIRRDFWTLSEIRNLVRFFEDILLQRRNEWGYHGGKARKRMSAEAARLWAVDVD